MTQLLETTVSAHITKLAEHEKILGAMASLSYMHDREVEALKKQVADLTKRISVTEQQLAEVRSNAC